MSHVLLIDNYDSFVHNLARSVRELGCTSTVLRNDAVSLAEIVALAPDAIILSPGPGGPQDTGICMPLLRTGPPNLPILGVCLGHQAIGAAFGGRVQRAEMPRHGEASAVFHSGGGVFAGMPNPFPAARYHSLIVAPQLPSHLIADAHLADGTVMGLSHRTRPIFGVQFHPESILTGHGESILQNFLLRATAASRS